MVVALTAQMNEGSGETCFPLLKSPQKKTKKSPLYVIFFKGSIAGCKNLGLRLVVVAVVAPNILTFSEKTISIKTNTMLKIIEN